MKAIVSVDLNWGIGFKGNLLQRIPEDMKRFKELTIGKVVVMGRGTFESLPGKAPLKDRVNIVLSSSGQFDNEGLILCRSLPELFRELKHYNPDDVFIIGGEAVYKALLPYCTEAYVTKINKTYEADKYFADLDRDWDWEVAETGDVREYGDVKYRYITYRNNGAIKVMSDR